MPQALARAILGKQGLITLPSFPHISQTHAKPLAQTCLRGFCPQPEPRPAAPVLHPAARASLPSRPAGNGQGPEGAQGIQLHFGFPHTHTSSSEQFSSHPRKIFARSVKPRLGSVSSKCQRVSAGEKLIRQNGPHFSREELLCDHCRKDGCGLMVKLIILCSLSLLLSWFYLGSFAACPGAQRSW